MRAMYDWGYGHMSGGGWFFAIFTCFLLLAILVVGVVALVRYVRSPEGGQHSKSPAGPTPDEVLKLRLAKGEIDPDEYDRRSAALKSHP